jgi:hypothetical protein
MKIRRLLKKEEKKEERKADVGVKQPSELEIFCGEDKEVYEAFSSALLLNPQLFKKFSIEEVLKEANQKEMDRDFFGAGLCYLFAGQLSLFNGDVEGVKKFFSRCQELTGRNYLILMVVERAVKKAQEYYKILEAKAK